MPAEQPAKLALTNFQPSSKRGNIAAVERSGFDQFQRPRYRRFRAAPGIELGRTFWSAAQARPKTCHLCSGRRRHENTVFQLGRTRRTDRPAIDAGCLHTREKSPIVPGITCLDCAVTNCRVEVHNMNYKDASDFVSRFSDFNAARSADIGPLRNRLFRVPAYVVLRGTKSATAKIICGGGRGDEIE